MLQLCGLVMMLVLVVGAAAAPVALADIYYSPEYKFSFDYPSNSNISNLTTWNFDKMFVSPNVSFTASVNKSSMVDPQEFAVSNSLKLPPHQTILEGGVHPFIQDSVLGYYNLVMNHHTGSIMAFVYFNHSDNLYSFIVMGPNGSFDTRDIYKVINSIKFFS